jgi:hypothetical protein
LGCFKRQERTRKTNNQKNNRNNDKQQKESCLGCFGCFKRQERTRKTNNQKTTGTTINNKKRVVWVVWVVLKDKKGQEKQIIKKQHEQL